MARPLSFNQLLTPALKEYGLEEKARRYSIITSWSEIVGEKVASVSAPLKLENGILNVKVTDSAWRYELQMRKREILSKIAREYGPDEVVDIRWK
jgi:predicted nucleic acid-binding Zn ribbon protein